MERKPLKSLVREILEASGCLAEENGDSLETVMPQQIAKRLGLSEHQLLYFSPQESGNGEFISYSSELLDNIAQLIEDKGHFCKEHLPRLYLKKEGLNEIISQKLSLANAVSRSVRAEERPVSYLIFNFKYSAVSEEKKGGIVPVVINELTLSSPQEMLDILSKGYHEEQAEEWRADGRRPLEEIFRAASRFAEDEIRRDISDFERSLNRRLNKDVARLRGYYGTLKEEVEGRMMFWFIFPTGEEEEMIGWRVSQSGNSLL